MDFCAVPYRNADPHCNIDSDACLYSHTNQHTDTY